MAYYGHEFYFDGTRATFWGYIQIALVNMGWELHDDISATVKVYRSNGESGNEPYGYIWIDAGTGSYIQFRSFQYWNNATHVGVRPRYPGDSASNYSRLSPPTVPALGFIAGDKNIAFIHIHGATYGNGFGHLPMRFDNNITTAQGTAGTAGTITIASTAGMGIGKRIQICGNAGEGIDSLVITGAPDATTRIVDKLPRNYGSGSIIGAPASVFGCFYVTNANFFPVSLWGDSGTAGTATASLTIGALNTFNSILFYNEGKYYAGPWFVYKTDTTFPGQAMGGFGNNIINSYNPQLLDAVLFNNDDSFPEPFMLTGITANTISNNKCSWTVNEHAGKFCVIVGGQATGVVKKILSNTSDTLTLDSDWYDIIVGLSAYTLFPSGGTEFKIVDSVYRGIVSLFNNYGYMKLTSTTVPT